MGVFFLGFYFLFCFLVIVAWISGSQHDLCSSMESLSKLGTGPLAFGAASGLVLLFFVVCTWAAEVCQSWGKGHCSDWYNLYLSSGSLLACGTGYELGWYLLWDGSLVTYLSHCKRGHQNNKNEIIVVFIFVMKIFVLNVKKICLQTVSLMF